ncbi:MAG: hypothetical protein CL840_08520 [Crocinitomicaceae bacterium]|nr:hypothetical protein [Crocinitomicaceae bacterium]|tara:strand:+ start:46113 stop:47060 length:948 start_codon:yes stop_codon:yes gene_type:complete
MKILKSVTIGVIALVVVALFAFQSEKGKGQKCHQGKHVKISPEMKAKVMDERVTFDKLLSASEKETIAKARVEMKEFRVYKKGLDKSTMTEEDWKNLHIKKKEILGPLFKIAENHKEDLMAVKKKIHGDAYKGCHGMKKEECRKGDKAKCCDKSGVKCDKGKYDKGDWDKKDPNKGGDKTGYDKGVDKGDWNKKDKGDYDKEKCKGYYYKSHAIRFLLLDPDKNPTTKGGSEARVFPNPSLYRNTLSFNHENDGELIIDLVDKEGKVIKQIMNEYRNAGTVEIEVDVSELSGGNLYFYRISDNGTISNQKFMMAD